MTGTNTVQAAAKSRIPSAAAIFAAIDDPMQSRDDIDEMVFAFLNRHPYPLPDDGLNAFRSRKHSAYTTGDISELAWSKVSGLVSFMVSPQRSINEAKLIFHRSDLNAEPQGIKVHHLIWTMPKPLRADPEFVMLKCLVQAIDMLRTPEPVQRLETAGSSPGM